MGMEFSVWNCEETLVSHIFLIKKTNSNCFQISFYRTLATTVYNLLFYKVFRFLIVWKKYQLQSKYNLKKIHFIQTRSPNILFGFAVSARITKKCSAMNKKKKIKKVEKYKKIKLEKVTKIKSVLSPFLGELTSGISLCWSGRLLSGFGFAFCF